MYIRWDNTLLAYLLTCSMVQSPSWEVNWSAASQEIPRISRNPKVHFRTHKPPLPVSILGQPNPVHIPTSHLLEIHSNIIHPSTPKSPHWSLSLRFPHQDPILGKHLIERKEKLDQQSRFDRFLPVRHFISHLKQLFESDEGTHVNTDERSLYVNTRLHDAICNRMKWNTRNNAEVQIDAYI